MGTFEKRILIIDDDDLIQAVAELTLGAVPGWTVTGALSGKEGLQLAADHPPDLILLDWMMPGLDGPATLERLQAHPATRAIPVLMLTAKTGAESQAQVALAGAVGMLAKPFDPATLAERIASLMDWSAPS